MSKSLMLEPIVSWPREVEFGRSYMITVDMRAPQGLTGWPYEEEEIELTCVLETEPWFVSRLVNEPILVLHRFGGTYRPVRYVISARNESVENEEDGMRPLWLSYLNRWGVVLRSVELPVHVVRIASDPPAKSGVYEIPRESPSDVTSARNPADI